MKIFPALVLAFVGLLWQNNQAIAQSPDSRICNCFSDAVSADVMTGTKAIYGSVGIMVSRNMELPPSPTQVVSFSMPILPLRYGCQAYYTMYITTSHNKVVYHVTSTQNVQKYIFKNGNETYNVQLLVTGKSATGGDGNCSRAIRFTVKPRVLIPRS